MNIVIPSYGRPNNVKTLDLLKNEDLLQYVTLFVVEEEYDAYRANYSDVKIIVGELGIVNQRNFISDYYNDGEIIISMDDDIEDYTHRENKPMKVWINDCIEYLKNSKCELISFPPSSNPFFCKGKEFNEGRYLAVGMFHIYKNDKHKLTIPYLEDYERSLHYIHKNDAVIRYGFVCFGTKYFADGGCNITRTRDSYLHSVYKILYAFPNDLTYNIKKSGMMRGLPNVKINKKVKNLNVIQLPHYTHFEPLYNMFEKITLRKRYGTSNRINFPIHRGAVFGIVKERFSKCKINESLDTRTFPHVWEELQRIGNIICPFKWKTIYVNKDLVCPPHKDKSNTGPSLLISFGNYTGGLIVVEKIEYNAYHTPTIFDGKKMEHWNTEFTGTKYSLVFY